MEYKKADEPQAEKLVTIEGTGTYKVLAKGSIHQVPQAEADALIASGRAKASKKSVEVETEKVEVPEVKEKKESATIPTAKKKKGK